MADDGRRLLVCVVVKRASDTLSDPHASANEDVDVRKCLLGIGWAKQLTRYASSHKTPQMIRRELPNTSARPLAQLLRADLRAVRFSVDGASSAGESQWWASVEKEGLIRGASREGWEEVLTRLEERPILCPEDLEENRCDFIDEVTKNRREAAGSETMVSCHS